MMDDLFLEQIGDKLYMTSRAYVVETASELPRELASEYDKDSLNESCVWIAGRYVQANNTNKNGHYWTYDDIQRGEQSIKYTPLNVLHRWDRPVGTFVETKIVQREDRIGGTDRLLPEIQALSILWGANFPEVARQVRDAHAAKRLWYSMECVAEAKQCLTCEEVYPFRASASEVCEHLATSKISPRRFINPTFLGGALVFPPASPAWSDADITEVAHRLVVEYASRMTDVEEWEAKMAKTVEEGS